MTAWNHGLCWVRMWLLLVWVYLKEDFWSFRHITVNAGVECSLFYLCRGSWMKMMMWLSACRLVLLGSGISWRQMTNCLNDSIVCKCWFLYVSHERPKTKPGGKEMNDITTLCVCVWKNMTSGPHYKCWMSFIIAVVQCCLCWVAQGGLWEWLMSD